MHAQLLLARLLTLLRHHGMKSNVTTADAVILLLGHV
jgi:hypothetical protein